MKWRLFLARILDKCVQERTIGDLNQTWSSWTQSVRDKLGNIVMLCFPVLSGATDRDSNAPEKLDGFVALRGKKNELVSDTLAVQEKNPANLQIATIHSVKGKEFHAVMLVSSPDKRGGKGGHWAEWLVDAQSEHARFAYVASSRPKYYLAWAIPASEKGKDENLGLLQKIGFVFEELPELESSEGKSEAPANE
jgi:superfamily I DNA/RNA helicase